MVLKIQMWKLNTVTLLWKSKNILYIHMRIKNLKVQAIPKCHQVYDSLFWTLFLCVWVSCLHVWLCTTWVLGFRSTGTDITGSCVVVVSAGVEPCFPGIERTFCALSLRAISSAPRLLIYEEYILIFFLWKKLSLKRLLSIRYCSVCS